MHPQTTPRLLLRPPEEKDAPAFADAARENLDDPFFCYGPDHLEPAALQAYLKTRSDGFQIKQGELFFLIWRQDRLVGEAGLQPVDGEDGHFNLSYWIRRSVAAQGIATEAANALTRYAFNALKARSVSISCQSGNHASRRIIEKLGFVRYAQEIKPDGRKAEIFRRTDLRGLAKL